MEMLQIWHNHSLERNDELIGFWWSGVNDQCEYGHLKTFCYDLIATQTGGLCRWFVLLGWTCMIQNLKALFVVSLNYCRPPQVLWFCWWWALGDCLCTISKHPVSCCIYYRCLGGHGCKLHLDCCAESVIAINFGAGFSFCCPCLSSLTHYWCVGHN